ncbi:YrbL family protein [Haliea sp. E1-2-M8]|uniref:YrbL family protein n=1 Tax=Haliea sp. E1-2-M8 TaxID=3064706 RepID=UPI002715AE3D|nr:YrbL family protein [Haliea sp. E1-2-M8]MDO8862955.1 YrbL family protein [Haliea sp. E1-2-M8]
MRGKSTVGSTDAGSPPDAVVRQLGSAADAFASGDSRLCFVDPLDPAWCIKILRPDRSPSRKRRGQSWLKRLKPLPRFDDNLQEIRAYRLLQRSVGQAAYQLIPIIDGLVPTNLGPGLRSELIRDDDGNISLTLQAYLELYGRNASLQTVLADFSRDWQALGMPSRRLLLHNLVVQQRALRPSRIVVVDSVGWPDLIPAGYWVAPWARHRAGRKLRYLAALIDATGRK